MNSTIEIDQPIETAEMIFHTVGNLVIRTNVNFANNQLERSNFICTIYDFLTFLFIATPLKTIVVKLKPKMNAEATKLEEIASPNDDVLKPNPTLIGLTIQKTVTVSIADNTKKVYLAKKYPPNPLQKVSVVPKTELMTCTVCYHEVRQDLIITYNGVSHEICKPCFVEYLTTQINNNKVR